MGGVMSSIVVSGDTSGAITIAAPAVAGTNTLTLPANTGTIITTASSGQSIPSLALPVGTVLQVVSSIYSTQTTNSTNVYADTGLTATITPKSATSKILILITHAQCYKSSDNSSNDLALNLCKNGSQIIEFVFYLGYTGTATAGYFCSAFNYVDSPATTSATTYKTQFLNHDNNGASVRTQAGGSPSTMVLMEIAA